MEADRRFVEVVPFKGEPREAYEHVAEGTRILGPSFGDGEGGQELALRLVEPTDALEPARERKADVGAPWVIRAPDALAELGDEAKVLAGGQSLVPMMALRLAAFGYLVDIGRIDAMKGIDVRDDGTSTSS